MINLSEMRSTVISLIFSAFLIQELLPFLEKGPKEHHAFLLQKRQRAAHDSAVINVAGKL